MWFSDSPFNCADWAIEARKGVVELLLSNHPADCLNCVRSGNCELQQLAHQMGIRKIRFAGEQSTYAQLGRTVPQRVCFHQPVHPILSVYRLFLPMRRSDIR